MLPMVSIFFPLIVAASMNVGRYSTFHKLSFDNRDTKILRTYVH